ncbi:MAG TPA: IgGFc-binding protein [Pseudomonadota bacterium]|nr:IgGFc-binding protein [Pseudomonadota bacterium]
MARSSLGFVVLGLVGSCNPATGNVDEDGPMAPDMSIPPPPPPPSCDEGRIRCNANRDGTERCMSNSWIGADKCNIAGGDACIDGKCLTPCEQVTRGNVGCSFYPANLWSTSLVGDFGIVVTNTSDRLTASVTLSDASGVIETKSIPPAMGNPAAGVAIFRLSHDKNKLAETEIAKKGFYLKSTAPVAVYQFHPIDAATVFSGSATLLLPEHVMAKNYFVMSYTYNAEHMTFPPQGAGLLAVMALTDDTMVEVTPPVATAKGPGVPALRAGETVRRLLKRLEVMEIVQANSREDISGAVVKASAPVVVYGGAGGVTIPASAVGGNHLGVQMFPLETWGKRYVGAKVKQRNLSDKDYYRIVASVDNTNVTIKSTTMLPAVPPLSKGQIYEFATDADFVVESDQPILVFQYMPAWGNLTGRYDPKEFPSGVSARCPFIGTADDVKCLGDANITPLVPVEQYRNDYIFYVPQTYSYDFINVTAAPDAKLSLDGQAITTPFRGIADGTIGRMIIRIEKPGNHRITSTKPFGLLGYGYAYATSYSYAGGLNLDKINPIE